MIGARGSLPAARWREKLSPPRPLREGDGFLYGPPLREGASAFLAWIFDPDPDAALHRTLDLARGDGASALYAGGPPGNYLVSGADAPARQWLLARGFDERSTHLDLCVDPRGQALDPRVELPDDLTAALAFVTDSFGAHWGAEAQRASVTGGLRVTRDEQGLTGFVAAGGNNADAGTFGPVGVLPRARGHGLGEALTRAALHLLAAQGFDEVTIPWVDRGLLGFYRGCAKVLREDERAWMRRALSGE
jgi:ribosomal protein S18 acetylase RimI-like enzyme